ncbi:MAG: hypothetical protein WAZ96_05500 [Candidatus Moraniibacteriota bacterium]
MPREEYLDDQKVLPRDKPKPTCLKPVSGGTVKSIKREKRKVKGSKTRSPFRYILRYPITVYEFSLARQQEFTKVKQSGRALFDDWH